MSAGAVHLEPLLEPEAHGCVRANADVVALSTAISLKRIADALTSADGVPPALFNSILDLAYQAGTNFEAGKRVG